MLGAGPAAVSALFWLTSTPELRARYDITVHQMGWRIGGKGASGRTDDGRILEHGLHILFGFYHNFFFTIRAIYAELARPAGHPLRTWRQAFHPREIGVEEEWVQGAWDPWVVPFPGNSGVPGSHGALRTPWQWLQTIVQGLITVVGGWKAANAFTTWAFPRGTKWEQQEDPPLGGKDPLLARLVTGAGLGLVRFATHLVRWVDRHLPPVVRLYHWMRRVLWWGIRPLARKSRFGHRLWRNLDAGLAMLTGMLADGLLLPGGFDAVDQYDFKEWLLRHGIHEETLSTPMVRTVYDAAFSYEDGDPDRMRCSAGSSMRVFLLWLMTYQGAGFYRMQSGMGDVVFGPAYLVLKARGVKFEFFHKVESLHLDPTGTRIERVRINEQAALRAGLTEYQPLVTIKGLECWPAAPLTAQLADPERFRGVDFEEYYSTWVGRRIDLVAGRDYDRVLFGIPVGAVPFLCRELVENPRTPQWKAMVEHVKSVQTVAAQLWLRDDIHALGWPTPEPLLSLFVEPYNTWADMSQVLPTEGWSANGGPKDVSYLCGAQIGPRDCPPLDQLDFPKRMTKDARDALVTFLRGRSRNPSDDPAVGGLADLLPGGAEPGDPKAFDWERLFDASSAKGEARLAAQYWRSNHGPSERCTLSLPDSNRHRIAPGATGYENLVITGDWTDNRLYLAFMEATFQSGILAARAIAGEEFPIIGEWLNDL